MKSPIEIADSFFVSAKEHANRATALRRLSGGVKTHVNGALGLDSKEQKLLLDAIALLERMATASDKAKTICAKRVEEREQHEKKIRAAMTDSFCAINTIPGKIALIGAVQSHLLQTDFFKTIKDLDYYFSDAINSLAYTLTGQDKEFKPEETVCKAWEKFNNARASIEEKHYAIIGRLMVAESRPSTSN